MSLSPAVAVHATDSTAGDSRRALAVFAVTAFLGSVLLFFVEPMFAKLLLPRLGGSPSVWNTCVLFFQTMLLLGYLYAHFSTRWLGVRRQIFAHVCVLALPLAFLPLAVGEGEPAPDGSPVWWLLRTLTLRIGMPFFVLSASAPLLQRWFSALPIASAGDPYFLYAASNLGSMVALIGYPFVVEPLAGVSSQTTAWTAGYVVLAALTVSCALLVWSRAADRRTAAIDEDALPLSTAIRVRWVLLSLVPSSLMLGVTTHISTDIAAVPLLWVVPLALYLATFVIAFSRVPWVRYHWIVWLQPGLVSICLFTMLANALTAWLIPVHLVTFFVCALVCHHELAARRPDVRYLTEFYIWISVGGSLGGVFNTLIAPHVFTQILEYPIVLAVATLIRPSPHFRAGRKEPWPLLIWTPAVALLLSMAVWAAGLTPPVVGIRELLLGVILLTTIVYVFVNRPEPFGIMALLFVAVMAFGRPARAGSVLFAARSFFGVHRVVEAPDHHFRVLQHGSTNHGIQEIATASGCVPTGYYDAAGPIGQTFAALGGRFRDVAVVGLGAGGLACYAEPGQRWTFYEIDPIVERIAREPRYFTFLEHSQAELRVVLGDGRLSLRRAAAASYDLIVLDAFSSDAIPMHLLTRQALDLYLSRLRGGGLIAVHISNRFLDLEPVLSALVTAENLAAIGNADTRISEADAGRGRWPSVWLVLAAAPASLDPLSHRPGWRPLSGNARDAVWTDDYSNLLQALRPQR